MTDICPATPFYIKPPERICQILALLLIGVVLPIFALFGILFVLPDFHETGSFWHTLSITLAIFLLFNIEGNWLACMLINTSIDFKTLQPPEHAEANGWRMCMSCQKWTPPRAWHCMVCGTCILKRDHHCIFTGCCVGHRNHRYFMLFIFHFFIGASYAFVYNSIYLWVLHGDIYINWQSLVNLMCVPLMLCYGYFWQNIHLLFYFFNIMALVLSSAMLSGQVPNVVRGGVCFEIAKLKFCTYDAGWRRNLEHVFGKRMHLVWLSPLIRSELPHDGDAWVANEACEGDKATTTSKEGTEEVDVVEEATNHLNIPHQIESTTC